MSRRSPEQVHEEDGHAEFVASCKRCASEVEADSNAALGREQVTEAGDGAPVVDEETGIDAAAYADAVDRMAKEMGVTDEEIDAVAERLADVRVVPAGHEGPLPEVDPAMYADDSEPLEVEADRPRRQLVNGRPKCHVETCRLPEFADDIGLCGGHWSTRPDLRKEARRA